jgi:DNA-binding winged helix-turn-helix (wHTH) protein
MPAMDMTNPVALPADWTFSAADGSLVRGTERRRLENRSAEVLRYLARRRGAIVTQQELIDEVWDGRIVSANSVAIAIADIRRALGDDARAPRFIETVPKRGYRLAPPADSASAELPLRRRQPAYALAAAVVVVGGTGIALFARTAEPAKTLSVESFVNATGDRSLDPLTVSVRELAVTQLGQAPTIKLLPPAERPALALTGKLIIWSGHPSVSVALQDRSRHAIVWTGMAPGPENALPGQMKTVMTDMERKLAR